MWSVGVRWFGKAGGMPSLTFAPVSGRYLSFTEREEIAVLLAGGCGVREIARQLGRAPLTISRELQRNAALRTGRPEYRASTAQTHADRHARDRSRSTRSCGATCRTGSPAKCSGPTVVPRVRRSAGVGGVTGRERIGAGHNPGVRSRSPVACALTSPMMSRCVSLMRRSISRSISRAAARGAES